MSPFDCPALQCPFSAPYRCNNGLCAHSEWECPEAMETTPTARNEFQCKDQSVVSNPEDCPLSYHCPAPYHRCQNGLCVLSLSFCPVTATPISVSSSLNLNHPSLQFLKENVNDFITSEFVANGNSPCSELAPFLCATGECVTSFLYCPAIRPCSSLYLKNGDYRCPDRSCIADSRFCSNSTVCPSSLPVMCLSGPYSGMCVSDDGQCLGENGCPLSLPYRCLNGQCVASQANCMVVSSSNGCPSSSPVRCNNQQCVASLLDCPLVNGCPPTAPFKSRNGNCYASPENDPSFQNNTRAASCSSTVPTRCWDGTCVVSPGYCPSISGCSLSSPIRCASGECKSYPHQYSMESFIGSISGSWIDEKINDQISNDVCQPTPVCPPDLPYLCADMSCVSDYSACRPCKHCKRKNLDWALCPSSRPIYCEDGSCVSNQGDCKNFRKCPANEPYECFNGRCARSPLFCLYHALTDMELVYVSIPPEYSISLTPPRSLGETIANFFFWWREKESNEQTSPYSFAMCSNGMFQDSAYCSLIPPCPSYNPKRCYTGECVPLDTPCNDQLFVTSQDYSDVVPLSAYTRPYSSVTSHNEVRPLCLFGKLCSDGLCRPSCKETSGCGLNRIMCPDGLCVDVLPGYNETELCLGHGNCEEDKIRCYFGSCMDSLSDCSEHHYTNFIAMEALIHVTVQEVSSVLLYTTNHDLYGELEIEAKQYLYSNEVFFVQITPVSAEDLSRQRVVIAREERAKELHLNFIESAVLFAMSPAIHIRFISIDNRTTITQLNYPMTLSLLAKSSARYLPSVVYDNSIYYDPLDVQTNEICPAVNSGDTWNCLDESDYVYENGMYFIRVNSEMDIMLMVSPKEPLSTQETEWGTVVEVFTEYLIRSLLVTLPIIVLLLIVLVFSLRWRLKWELSKESYKTSRIRTDKEAVLLKESSHTGDWLQIERDVKGQDNTNPLAMRRIMKDMFNSQMTEAQEIAKHNEEIIAELTEEKKAIMVGLGWRA